MPLTRVHKLLLSLAAIILFFIAYSNHFNNPFEFDDEHTIVTNTAIRKLSNIPLFYKDATTTSTLPKSQAYRPGLTTLNAFDFALGGQDVPIPFYFHLSIFISIFILGICIFFFSKFLFQAFLNPHHTFLAALITATLFCVHTANSQTINYIISRDDSFSTLMVVIGFMLYFYSPLAKRFYLYLLPIIFGFLVKEPAVMFAPLLFCYQLLFERNPNSEKNPLHFPNWLRALKTSWVAFALVLFLFVFSQSMTPKTWTSGNLDRWSYLISQPFVVLHYFNNFFFPFNLVIDTDWEFLSSIRDDRFIVGVAFLIGLVYLIFKFAKRQPIVSFGIAWFLLTLLPSSSIIPLSEVLNDHRPFFGYIGLSIVSVYALAQLYKRYKSYALLKPIYIAFTFCILFAHAAGTYYQNRIWSSAETVWKEATLKSPKNGRAWMNYGLSLMSRGAYTEAEQAFNTALSVWPAYPYLFVNMGILQSATNRFAEAESNFKKAIQLDIENPECYVFYAKHLLKTKQISEAEIQIQTGLSKSPSHATLQQLKKEIELNTAPAEVIVETKIRQALEAVKKQATHESYLELSLAYYNAGRFEDCIKACEASLKLKQDYVLAYNNICSAYNQLEQWDKAIEAGEKGLRIDPTNELLKGNLQLAKSKK
jgi:protein O-mannosyl-transferase